MIALQRRAVEGGSWLVRVSLAQTGRWLTSLGRTEHGTPPRDLSVEEIRGWTRQIASPFGQVSALAPVPLGTHAPEWL